MLKSTFVYLRLCALKFRCFYSVDLPFREKDGESNDKAQAKCEDATKTSCARKMTARYALRQISLKAPGQHGVLQRIPRHGPAHNVLFALIYHPEIKGCQTTTESIVVSATRRIGGSLRSCTLCPVIIRRQKRREIVRHAAIYLLSSAKQ